MDEAAGQVHPVRPSQVAAALPVSAAMAHPMNSPSPHKEAALAEPHQSATLSTTPPAEDADAQMLRLLNLAARQATQLAHAPAKDLRAQVESVERDQTTKTPPRWQTTNAAKGLVPTPI